ncbi:glycosyltransferase family protein [Aquimarina sp. 2201CG5-10]|uniref:glycosyltransferase family protein n=1 Tax=Aquimarina callyspongiae TaxID=3098150 RepID=UPI002AB3615D|nr:glycosyltransferase family protein [Aquimarina sp. 2201CG5-10]MDY8138673.1 glycosyltransferase family protein [Aquimarina sp. 2201CG5-10]
MKTVVITQARSGSTRLPNKVLKEIKGKSLLEIHINRIKGSKLIDEIFIATTINKEDDKIEELAKLLNVKYYRGSEDDVLDRFYQTIHKISPDYIVRLTSDCPLIDPILIDEVIQYTKDNDLDYCSNTLEEHYPDGQDIEVFKFSALEKAWKESKLKSEREHVTPYIYNKSTYRGEDLFKSDNYGLNDSFNGVRLTVDEISDFQVIKIIIENLGCNKSWLEYARYYQENEEINKLNNKIIRNEGYLKSIKEDKDE